MTPELASATMTVCVASVLAHILIALWYSRKYIPIVGRGMRAFETDFFLYDGDPLYSAYPHANSMSSDGLRRALSHEIRDIWTFADNTSEVFMHVTDGRISKATTRADAVIALHDDCVQDAVEYAVNDIRNEDRE